MRAITLAGVAVVLVSTGVGAQTGSSAWLPFVGCWVAADTPESRTLTCLLPDPDAEASVEMLSIAGGEVIRRSTIAAHGRRVEVADGPCTGWERAWPSDDAARVYVTSELTCASGVTQRSETVFSLNESGDYVTASVARIGEERRLAVARLVEADPSLIPSEIRARLDLGSRAVSAARLEASRGLSVDVVVDVSRQVDEHTAEAWLAETASHAKRFRLPLNELERLAAARVPARVIDMAVVAGNPTRFRPMVEAGEVKHENVLRGFGGGASTFAFCDMTMMGPSFWGMGRFGFLGMPYGGLWLMPMDPMCAPFMSAYSWRGMYGMYGSTYGFGLWPYRWTVFPTTPGTGPATQPRGSGRVSRTGGYRARSDAPGGSTAQPRSAPATSSSGTASSGRSSGSSSGRTAKPRQP